MKKSNQTYSCSRAGLDSSLFKNNLTALMAQEIKFIPTSPHGLVISSLIHQRSDLIGKENRGRSKVRRTFKAQHRNTVLSFVHPTDRGVYMEDQKWP